MRIIFGQHNRTQSDWKQLRFYENNISYFSMFEKKDFNEFVELLNSHKVKYLLIGGWAVGFHGFPRFTGDMDIWVNPDEDTAEKMLNIMREFGFASLRFSKNDFLKNGIVIQLGFEPSRIDVIIEQEGFAAAYKKKITHRLKDFSVFIVGYNDLIKLKEKAGRDQDMIDIKRLKKANEKKRTKK